MRLATLSLALIIIAFTTKGLGWENIEINIVASIVLAILTTIGLTLATFQDFAEIIRD